MKNVNKNRRITGPILACGILAYAKEPMTPMEILEEARKRGLYDMYSPHTGNDQKLASFGALMYTWNDREVLGLTIKVLGNRPRKFSFNERNKLNAKEIFEEEMREPVDVYITEIERLEKSVDTFRKLTDTDKIEIEKLGEALKVDKEEIERLRRFADIDKNEEERLNKLIEYHKKLAETYRIEIGKLREMSIVDKAEAETVRRLAKIDNDEAEKLRKLAEIGKVESVKNLADANILIEEKKIVELYIYKKLEEIKEIELRIKRALAEADSVKNLIGTNILIEERKDVELSIDKKLKEIKEIELRIKRALAEADSVKNLLEIKNKEPTKKLVEDLIGQVLAEVGKLRKLSEADKVESIKNLTEVERLRKLADDDRAEADSLRKLAEDDKVESAKNLAEAESVRQLTNDEKLLIRGREEVELSIEKQLRELKKAQQDQERLALSFNKARLDAMNTMHDLYTKIDNQDLVGYRLEIAEIGNKEITEHIQKSINDLGYRTELYKVDIVKNRK